MNSSDLDSLLPCLTKVIKQIWNFKLIEWSSLKFQTDRIVKFEIHACIHFKNHGTLGLASFNIQ